MNADLLDILACPGCGGGLTLAPDGALTCTACRRSFPVVRQVPRFVPDDSYASSFGFQWNAFKKTQLDSHTGLPISRERFFRQSRWTAEELAGKRVLDLGCGAGRFAEIALSTGANVVAVDYSNATDACYANLGPHPRLSVVQADVYRLPFRPGSFDYVYCFGVLQHTPDPHGALLALVTALHEDGRIAVDFYPRLVLNVLWPKYWLRPFTRRLRPERLFTLVQSVVPKLLPLSRALAAVPLLGRRLRYALPIMTYHGVYAFDERQHREWAILDTFDMFAPAHDHPQSVATVRAWLEAARLRDIEVERQGQVVARATK